MSGKKTTYVQVDQSDWQRAQNAARRLRDVQADLPRLLDGVREQTRRDIEQAARAVERRQQAVEVAFGRLSEQTRRVERETNRRLAAQAAELHAKVDTAVTEVRADTAAALAAQESRLRSSIAAERRQREQDVAELRTGINALLADRRRAAETAGVWISDANVLLGVIRTELPHERYAPGRLTTCERDLRAAEAALADGFGEAALAEAQRAVHALSDLRVEIEWADREWQLVHQAAREALLVVRAGLDDAAVRAAIDADGNEVPEVTVEVDYWTDGGLARLRSELDAELAAVDAQATPPDLGELRRIVAERAPELLRRIDELVEQARLAQLGSQIRVNVADVAVDLLTSSGFELVDHTYAGKDQRSAFYAKVVHPDGSEVVVDVSPTDDGPATAELRILSYDEAGSDELRVNRATDLAAGLRELGLRAGDPAPDAAGPEERYRDFAALRAQRPAAGRAAGRQ
jgi:hypothetical protein